jgi:hypothetical protein
MISRRQFLRGALAVGPIVAVAPTFARTIFLPPAGGWAQLRPLTLEEIIKRAVRARASRIAEDIVQHAPLLQHLRLAGVVQRRAAAAADAFAATGHLVDIARDERAIAAYLVEGLPLTVAADLRFRVPNQYTGTRVTGPRAETLPVPLAYRVSERIREPFSEHVSVAGGRMVLRSIDVEPADFQRLNAGYNG